MNRPSRRWQIRLLKSGRSPGSGELDDHLIIQMGNLIHLGRSRDPAREAERQRIVRDAEVIIDYEFDPFGRKLLIDGTLEAHIENHCIGRVARVGWCLYFAKKEDAVLFKLMMPDDISSKFSEFAITDVRV
jgi:hypothetical protein